jgi:hypothetical protein
MSSISTAHLKTRPQRIAFLVDPDAPDAAATIFQIINFSNKCWGGGYYPILPTDGKKIDNYWWRLLTHYDPDIISTTLDLEPPLVSQIYRESVPCRIVKSHERNLSNLNPVNCLHIPSFLSQVKPYSWNLQPIYLASPPSRHKRQHDAFFNLNFGLIEQTVSADLLLDHSSINKIVINETVHPNSFLIDAFGYTPTKPLFPKDVAKFWCNPTFSVKHNHLARAFHLVIGDTANDLIWARNRSLTSSGYNGRDLLWVPKIYFDAPEFYNILNEWISKVYWDNTGSQAKGCIISSSLTSNELEEIKSKLQEGKSPIRWSVFDNPNQLYQQLEFEDYWKITTTHIPIENVGLMASLDCHFRTHNYSSTARLQPVLPPFINNQACTGELMVDLDLDYQSSKRENSAFRLRLPKRYDITRSLVVDNYSRPLKDGKVSIQVSATEASFTIREPSAQAVLTSFGYATPEKIEKQINYQSPIYVFETSPAGNSLVRLLEVFGSLKLAAEFFDDPIWVLVALRFCNLQAVDFQNEKELEALSKTLHDSAQDIPGTDKIPEDFYVSLAQRLQGSLNHRLSADKYLSKMEIIEICNKFVGQRIKEKDKQTNWDAVTFKHHYEPTLEELLRRGVLRLGSQLCCSYCGHKPWILLDDLRHKSNCSACGSDIEIPLEPSLTFRLNDIVREAIRENSLPYVIRELYEQGRFLGDMFDYLPSQNIFLKGSNDIFTDLDIVVFRGTDLVIGEVKSEPTGLKSKDIFKLLEVTKQMRPQEVIIVTQEGTFDPPIQIALNQLMEECKNLGIKFKVKQLKRLITWFDDNSSKQNAKNSKTSKKP